MKIEQGLTRNKRTQECNRSRKMNSEVRTYGSAACPAVISSSDGATAVSNRYGVK
jgi:hypothetical protein